MNENPVFSSHPSGRFFIKMHGLQNHFVITDGRTDAYRPDATEIIRICDVKVGIGGDQLVIIEHPTDQGRKSGANAFMRLYNTDSREVEACGNATRCVAWLLLQELGVDTVVVETLAGLIECKRVGEQMVSCTMGHISTRWQDIPLAEARDTMHLELRAGSLDDAVALNIGNPHVVYFVDDLDAIDVSGLAPGIQRNALFPNEVNVGVAQVLSEDHLRLTVFERGAGLTTACGSGACVATFAARMRGLTQKNKMRVTMPAGDMIIDIDAEDCATMSGPVEYCFAGYI